MHRSPQGERGARELGGRDARERAIMAAGLG